MDLERLRIDRERTPPGKRRAGRGGLGKWLALALLLGLVWLLRRPLLATLDRLRLPTVEVAEVYTASAADAGAISGAAANGYVVARNRAALSADTPGRIVELLVEEGSVVTKDQVVARLFSAEVEAALRAAEGEVTSAEQAVRRSEEQVRGAESTLARAQADARTVASDRDVRARDTKAAEARAASARARSTLTALELERARTLVAERISAKDSLDRAMADDEGARADLQAAQAELAAAQSAEEQARLSAAGADAATAEAAAQLAVQRAALEEARARVPVQAALRDQVQATLDKLSVRAPFDGVVVLKDAEVGEVVSPNSLGGNSRGSVVTMIDFASLEVQVDLPETSLSAVEVGGPATIFLDAYPGQPYPGRVDRIWPTANRQKATVEVRVAFLERDEKLRPELGARVVFAAAETKPTESTAQGPTLLVPDSAVIRIDGATGVFVLERDTARWRAVVAGAQRGGRRIVESGLEAGERVVVSPPAQLADGDRVFIKP